MLRQQQERLDDEQAVIRYLGDHGRRVCRDDHLAQRIIEAHGLWNVRCDVAQQPGQRRNAVGGDAVLRLLDTDERVAAPQVAVCLEAENDQRQEAKAPVREEARREGATVTIGDVEGQERPLFILDHGNGRDGTCGPDTLRRDEGLRIVQRAQHRLPPARRDARKSPAIQRVASGKGSRVFA